MARRGSTQLAFDALRVEGALIAPDMIAAVAALKAKGQSESDYRTLPGLKLRDEIGRYWRIAEALWGRFEQGRAGGQAHAATGAFVDDLLRQVFGFETLKAVSNVPADGREFPIRRVALDGRIPIAIAPAGEGLDRALDQFAEGHRKRSATLAVQELLNADDGALWGLATDGLRLRLLRDNASLTRPAFIEADLERIFEAGLYSDFTALWLLIHESRFGAADATPTDCVLERWREAGRDAGAKARDRLGVGVEAALVELGSGFVEHPANQALRDALSGGSLTPQALYEELLRVVYRLIFLFTTEDRGLLHDPGADDAARRLYAEGYGVGRLRALAARRAARDKNYDLYEGLKILFRALWRGEKALGLPALGGLFRGDALPNLAGLKVDNRRLLQAVFKLAWIEENHTLMRVNWRDMETEELGSVYEALLELTPFVDLEARAFGFREGATSGNARKISSSYYTPDSLVQLLLDKALDPLIDQTVAANPGREADTLLELTVLDPACGSGHFLLSAGRRIATRLAQLRSPGSPSAEDWRHALREVSRRCLFGVDRNPMAVELCRTALWIESIEPGKPLSFLDGHIQCGDSLVGVWDLKALSVGIPDAAYKALEGDDSEISTALRKVNKDQRDRPAERSLFGIGPADLSSQARQLEGLPEDELSQVEAKANAFAALRKGESWWTTKVACDLYLAAFFSPKHKREGALAVSKQADNVPTSADVWAAIEGHPPQGRLTALAVDTAEESGAFHWPLAFPQVMARGGFDCILGNPPWDTMSPDAKEWFAPFDPSIRDLAPEPQAARIAEILEAPNVSLAWDKHCSFLYRSAHFIKNSGRYTLFSSGSLGKGDFNVWRMFTELALNGVKEGGIAAQFVPENFYSGANASAIRQYIFERFELKALISFENRKRIWFDIDSSTKFALYVARSGGETDSFPAMFGVGTIESLSKARTDLPISIPVSLVREFSPDALAIADVAHPADIGIVQKLYAKIQKFGAEISGAPKRKYLSEVHMGNDREDFGDNSNGVPLYQGSMVGQFDYRAKAYASGHGRTVKWDDLPFGSQQKRIAPQWHLAVSDIPEKIGDRWRKFRIGFCDVGKPINQRTLMAALLPSGVVCGHTVTTITFDPPDPRLDMLWLAVANSFAIDYIVRKKAALHMSLTLMDSLPLPRTFANTPTERAIVLRSLRLTATGPEMDEFLRASAAELGVTIDQALPSEDPTERTRLRAELDVLVARDLFGLSRDEMRYVLEPADILGPDCGFETFGALARAERREFGSFATRDRILATWDTLPVAAMV